MVLAFAEEYRGEAPTGLGGGTEPRVAKRNAESPAFGSRWMEEVCGRENCRCVDPKVPRKHGPLFASPRWGGSGKPVSSPATSGLQIHPTQVE